MQLDKEYSALKYELPLQQDHEISTLNHAYDALIHMLHQI